MNKEQKFYKALQDVFIGAKIEGKGGFINLMRIKSNYYRKIEDILKNDIEEALKQYPKFRDELFDKLYSFFSRYFTESGSIYFNSTPFHNNVYEKIYTDEKDVILFWKTQMLYYVKTDRIFRNLEITSDGFKFFFDVSNLEHKKANEKRSLVFELDEVKDDGTIVFGVQYSEKGTKTKQEEILKSIKRKGISITEEQLERAFRIFEKQSEVDFFINKNAKAFLQEQFKLWSYQYFWEGANEWSADRVNQLQILKDIAFKIIDFISQFEDELVKIWNKPKFVKNSNYVITLDRIKDINLIEKILKHKNIKEQIKEWQELGIVDEKFKVEEIFEDSPLIKGWQSERLTGYSKLPYSSELKEKARELRKAGNLSEVLLWNELKQKKMQGFDFTRQQVIGDYIVDFHCPKLNLVIEIDGESHDFKGEYDEKRDKFLKSCGLTVLHFQDVDIKKNLSGVVESIKKWIEENTPSAPQTPLLIKGEYRHLPIDTKYFKDLELEILSQFEDLDKSLDGWLIKSENYQALNTILPKFKEKVQTIYIDPPFNTGEDFEFMDRYQDSSWLSLMQNRIDVAKKFLSKTAGFVLHLDWNANYLGRNLLENSFGKDNFINEIVWRIGWVSGYKTQVDAFVRNHDTLYIFANSSRKEFFFKKSESKIPYFSFKKDTIYDELESIKKKWGIKDKEIKNIKLVIKNDKNVVYKIGLETGSGDYNIEDTWNSSEYEDLHSNKIKRNAKEYTPHGAEITQKPEQLMQRIISLTTEKGQIILDYFAGSGTTVAVAHKLKRRWIGIEVASYFETDILFRMKQVLAATGRNEPCGITKDVNWQGGGFFKYYELEQYEEALENCKYEDGDLFHSPLIKGWTAEDRTGYWSGRSPYQEYVFLKDEKMLKALEIDYENNKVKVDLNKLYPNIDIAETLSNLTGKWIKQVKGQNSKVKSVVFEDGTEIDVENLDYKLIKPLIWW